MGLFSRPGTSSRAMMRARGPRIDLRPWAQRHGLRHVGNELIRGAVPALPPDPDHRFNVVMGLPGGTKGVVAHVVRRLADNSIDSARPIFAHEPWTVVALPVPEAVGTLLRFHAGRPDEIAENEWSARVDLGVPGVAASAAPGTDRRVLTALLDAGATELLRDQTHLTAVHFAFGCLWVERQAFLDVEDLERLAARGAALARALAGASLAVLEPVPFDRPLPAPAWLDGPGVAGHSLFTGREGEGLDAPVLTPALADFVRGIPAARGLEAEDALAFHRAFPRLPLRGQAIAVFRGDLGRGRIGRVVATNEVWLPERSGSDVALLGVNAPDAAPREHGEGVRVSIADGVLCASRRAGNALSGPSLVELGAWAVELAEHNGW